jgi:hypothetical protein
VVSNHGMDYDFHFIKKGYRILPIDELTPSFFKMGTLHQQADKQCGKLNHKTPSQWYNFDIGYIRG